MIACLREVLGSLFPSQPNDESPDIDRIHEMLDYLKDVPYVPEPARPIS